MTAVRLIKIPRFHWNVQRNLANHSLDKQDFQKPQRTSSSWRVYWRAAVRCAAKTVTMQCCWFLGGVPNSNFFWIAHLLFENAGSEKRAMPARAEKILYQNILSGYHLRNLWRFSRLKCKQKSGRVFWCALIKKLCFFISCSINCDKGVATLFWLKWQAQKLIEKVRMIKWCCALSCSLMTCYCLDLIKEKIVTNQMENFDWVPIWKEKCNQFNR